jgi:hypothetical protein
VNLIPFPRLHFFMLGFSPLMSHGSLFSISLPRLDPTATSFLMRLVACVYSNWRLVFQGAEQYFCTHFYEVIDCLFFTFAPSARMY